MGSALLVSWPTPVLCTACTVQSAQWVGLPIHAALAYTVSLQSSSTLTLGPCQAGWAEGFGWYAVNAAPAAPHSQAPCLQLSSPHPWLQLFCCSKAAVPWLLCWQQHHTVGVGTPCFGLVVGSQRGWLHCGVL